MLVTIVNITSKLTAKDEGHSFFTHFLKIGIENRSQGSMWNDSPSEAENMEREVLLPMVSPCGLLKEQSRYALKYECDSSGWLKSDAHLEFMGSSQWWKLASYIYSCNMYEYNFYVLVPLPLLCVLNILKRNNVFVLLLFFTFSLQVTLQINTLRMWK